jgi:hypothetical protein
MMIVNGSEDWRRVAGEKSIVFHMVTEIPGIDALA